MRLIDADALLKDLWQRVDDGEIVTVLGALHAIIQAPHCDAVPVVHGRWIDMQDDDSTEGMWRCSVCGDDRYFNGMATPKEHGVYYCPNCGARMDGDSNA